MGGGGCGGGETILKPAGVKENWLSVLRRLTEPIVVLLAVVRCGAARWAAAEGAISEELSLWDERLVQQNRMLSRLVPLVTFFSCSERHRSQSRSSEGPH